ncbi:hypothetical protein B0T17DRAFT_311499 [Bombardia bombarda]|uniref:Uncharacterized protein n=1 Tax=Bombardia bombarda TaxID=252184 RepID=A0AA39WLW2_9PEZI|nr:hypothetical protein B0T17DRAFT_311499 [Bombardia bombarda]
MRTLGSMLAETYNTWLRSVSSCCGRDDEKSHHFSATTTTEKPVAVLQNQPAFIPPPSAEPLWSSEQTYEKTLERERERGRSTTRRRSASRGSTTSRTRWLSRSSSTSRRPQISGPSDFRHLHSTSFQAPGQVHQRPVSFRPLELSIFMPDNHLSPLLPHFDDDKQSEDYITPPPPVHSASGRWGGSSSSATLTNDRSYSQMSFHLPRRHGREGSNISASLNEITPPRIPLKSRARAYTAPSPEKIVERIASAMLEKERLQAEIDSIIERQSIYISSRPGTAHESRDFGEPMPSIPALPAAAPSFAERLSNDAGSRRPHTAPSSQLATTTPPPFTMPTQQQQDKSPLALAVAAFNSHPPHVSASTTTNTNMATTSTSTFHSRIREHSNSPNPLANQNRAAPIRAERDRPLVLAPPLPLVLRPPLRKKKSFSRVSNWLFFNPTANGGNNTNNSNSGNHPQNPHQRGISLDSVTNLPRNVKSGEGFYQPHYNHYDADMAEQMSVSVETVSSTWETDSEEGEGEGDDDDDDDDEGSKTVPTTVTEVGGSSPVVIQNTPKRTPVIEGGPVFAASSSSPRVVTPLRGDLKTGMEMDVTPTRVGRGPRPQSVGVAF